ncbi:hypothetical protein [Nonomuraea typhae]|uniref:50S ribosomal protein L32 n=1 Tax=Nonomuraea typhae TaxID=2603600 RepID=A0ABW7YM23_9ACTN
MRVSVKVTLLTCKKCGRPHNNPFTHACVVGMEQLGAPASMRRARDAKKAAAMKRLGR